MTDQQTRAFEQLPGMKLVGSVPDSALLVRVDGLLFELTASGYLFRIREGRR